MGIVVLNTRIRCPRFFKTLKSPKQSCAHKQSATEISSQASPINRQHRLSAAALTPVFKNHPQKRQRREKTWRHLAACVASYKEGLTSLQRANKKCVRESAGQAGDSYSTSKTCKHGGSFQNTSQGNKI